MREFALYCLTDVASFGTFTDTEAGLEAEWEEETEHVDSEHNGERADARFVRVTVGEQLDLSRTTLAQFNVGNRVRVTDGANHPYEGTIEGFSILGDQGFIARLTDTLPTDMTGAYLEHMEIVDPSILFVGTVDAFLDVVTGVSEPQVEDIIACTLVGDDEVTDAALETARRIIADLEQAGFTIR